MEEKNTIKSYYNVLLESRAIDNRSDILAVILPGIGYTLDRPLLDYSKKLCVELGYDVLPIEYGFQAARKDFVEGDFHIVAEETYKLLKLSLKPEYKKIIFIGKSIGTIVQIILENKLIEEKYDFDFVNIYLTPVNKTVELGIKRESLVVSGTSDVLINEASIEKIENINDIEFIKIDKGDHSLNINNNIIKSSEILTYILEKEKDHIISKI